MYSKGAKALAEELHNRGYNVLRINGNYPPTSRKLYINWGKSTLAPFFDNHSTLRNTRGNIACAINKLITFQTLQLNEIPCPKFTTSTEKAQQWIDKGHIVIGRKLLNGSKGKGIIIFEAETITSNKICPLYTRYIKKEKEFRVYVYKGEVIDILQKKRKHGLETPVNTLIRTHGNGWVFCRELLDLPEDLHSIAIDSLKALGLDFGGVDIIWNKHYNKCYILEINTAPGIQGTSVESFASAIEADLMEQYLNGH
jgi:glutathione synthase/RimK-type ligase-like ATP-grasp enzyme